MMRFVLFMGASARPRDSKREILLFICLLGLSWFQCFGMVVPNVYRGKTATDLFDASPGLDSFSKVRGSTG